MAKKRKKKKKNRLVGIDFQIIHYGIEELKEMGCKFAERLKTAQAKRSYIQMDRDMVEKFFLNTRAQREETER